MGDYLRGRVENVTLSLVREFLSTKGFYTILLNMDVEIPRRPDSINSRQSLSAMLGLQRPAKGDGSILEALIQKTLHRRDGFCDEFVKKSVSPNNEIETARVKPPELREPTPIVKIENVASSEQELASLGDYEKTILQDKALNNCDLTSSEGEFKLAESKSSSVDSDPFVFVDENFKGAETDIQVINLLEENEVGAGEEINSDENLPAKETNEAAENQCDNYISPQNEVQDEEIAPVENHLLKSSIVSQKSQHSNFLTKLPEPKLNSLSRKQEQPNIAVVKRKIKIVEEAVAEEIQDLSEKTKPNIILVGTRPLTLPSAMELKSVLLGTPEGQFFKEWRDGELMVPIDGFQNIECGISGVLAVVQGFMVKATSFCSVEKKEVAFASAITEILWQSGQRIQACLAICGDEERLAGCGRYRRDGVTEAMVLLHFNSIEDTRAGVERHVEQLKAPGGLLLLVASLVLSKGLEEFRGRAPLLGKANVSLVNLTLTGRLDMREAKQRAEIGFLSLAEHYGHLKVPSCLKTPRWPIWVVEMGSENYAVISSTNPKLVADWRAELAFRLQIFDKKGLKNAAVSTGGEINEEEEKTATYLEMTIRTKWSGAQIQWIPNQ